MRHFIVFLSFLFLATTASAQQGWVPLTSGTTVGLNTLCVLNKDTVYASSGSIDLRTRDGGQTWQILTGMPHSGGLYFLDDTAGFLARLDTIYKTTDGGLSWTGAATGRTPLSTGATFVFIGQDSGWAFLGGREGFVFRTTDGGITWHEITVALGSGSINCMAFADTRHGFTMGNVHPWYFDPNFPHAASFERSNDGGATWTEGYTHLSKDVYGMAAATLDTLIGVGQQIARSTDGGDSWDTIAYGADGDNGFFAVSFPDPLHGTAVGTSGWIFHTTDGGLSWQRQTSPVLGNLNAVAFIDSLTGYACGGDGAIIKTTNGGFSWVQVSLISSLLQDRVYPLPANDKTSLAYSLPDVQRVTLTINGITGAGIAEVLSDEPQSAGPQSVTIDTSHLASGTYTYVLQSEKYYATGKIVVIH
jgi:photosystem II stability/assembly factor-like uncharacterized protein